MMFKISFFLSSNCYRWHYLFFPCRLNSTVLDFLNKFWMVIYFFLTLCSLPPSPFSILPSHSLASYTSLCYILSCNHCSKQQWRKTMYQAQPSEKCIVKQCLAVLNIEGCSGVYYYLKRFLTWRLRKDLWQLFASCLWGIASKCRAFTGNSLYLQREMC